MKNQDNVKARNTLARKYFSDTTFDKDIKVGDIITSKRSVSRIASIDEQGRYLIFKDLWWETMIYRFKQWWNGIAYRFKKWRNR